MRAAILPGRHSLTSSYSACNYDAQLALTLRDRRSAVGLPVGAAMVPDRTRNR